MYYERVVVSALLSLIESNASKDHVDREKIERIIRIKWAMNETFLDEEKKAWMRQDLQRIIDEYWDILKAERKQWKREEIARAALR